ncbi:MFS transporter [Gallaecimonas xiamenensis]|uniref:Cyanate transporter n=1 Tax=Gallaecimonas xiamenensis 3-C-1 TaxID=745411 RepID=K2JN20_9GAMM|nr:MFS transporter [Gallaecimonas xiamenensis]EKE75877.1 cyanate transporter [Gallaecimonas xiamenensis 3-C-1]
MKTSSATLTPLFDLLALLLVALNLRPALSSLGPVLPELGLSATSAGWLTTLPVLCLGLFAPLAPLLSRRLGLGWAVRLALLAILGGVLLRGLGSPWALFLGMTLAGAGIGVAGVLLPGIVKRDYPRHAGLMTGFYTMALCLGAAAAAGTMVPLARLLDAPSQALAFWALPAVLALLAWRRQDKAQPNLPAVRPKPLWHSSLAWQVTLYMGLQSSLAYTVFAWLPSMLISCGLTPEQAGWLTSVSIFIQAPAALLAPSLSHLGRNQKLPILLAMGLVLAGLMLVLLGSPAWLWPAGIVLGMGQGASFGLALALLVLRSADSQVAARLSGMAQGLGYTLAALGPLAVGAWHDAFDSWTSVAPLLAAIALAATLFGLLAGRDRQIHGA